MAARGAGVAAGRGACSRMVAVVGVVVPGGGCGGGVAPAAGRNGERRSTRHPHQKANEIQQGKPPTAAERLRSNREAGRRAGRRRRNWLVHRQLGRNAILLVKGGDCGCAGIWRWRIGDYRVAARIEDERITMLVGCGA